MVAGVGAGVGVVGGVTAESVVVVLLGVVGVVGVVSGVELESSGGATLDSSVGGTELPLPSTISSFVPPPVCVPGAVSSVSMLLSDPSEPDGLFPVSAGGSWRGWVVNVCLLRPLQPASARIKKDI